MTSVRSLDEREAGLLAGFVRGWFSGCSTTRMRIPRGRPRRIQAVVEIRPGETNREDP